MLGLSDPKFRKDFHDSMDLLAYIQKQIIIDAKITKLGLDVDEYIIDLYENGYTQVSTKKEIHAYSMYKPDKYKIDDQVQINMMPDDTALIVVRGALPPGTGLYKALLLLTPESPGRPGWDWWRFPEQL